MAKIQPKSSGNAMTTQVHDQLPAFMREETNLGLEELGEFIIPPRLKVVQKQSGPPFDEMFDPGSVVAVPQMSVVAGMQDAKNSHPFFFVPLFFFPEWCLWNPLKAKGTLPIIRARTTNPQDPMVAKCRDARLWHEQCPEMPEEMMRYVEHLNYLVMLLDHDLTGLPVILSFSRASHRSGSTLAALIRMRKAPIFGCQFMAQSTYRANNKGQWFGIDAGNPTEESGVTPYVADQSLFEQFKTLHLQLKEAHAKSQIRVDYDDVPESADADAAAPKDF